MKQHKHNKDCLSICAQTGQRVASSLYRNSRWALCSFFIIILAHLSWQSAPTNAAERQFFERLSICGGRAEITHMSSRRQFRYCPPGKACKAKTLYRYEVKCADGRVYSAPAIFYEQAGRGRNGLRLQGVVLSAYLGEKRWEVPNPDRECMKRVSDYSCPDNPRCYQIICLGRKTITKRQAVWATLPAGYAPLPRGAQIMRMAASATPKPASRPVTVRPSVTCDGGTLNGTECTCPSGYRRTRVSATRFSCQAAPPKQSAEGGIGNFFIFLLILGAIGFAAYKWKWIITWFYMRHASDPTQRIVEEAIAAGVPMDGPEVAAAMRTAAERQEPTFVTEERIKRAKHETARAETMADFADAAVRYSRAKHAQSREQGA